MSAGLQRWVLALTAVPVGLCCLNVAVRAQHLPSEQLGPGISVQGSPTESLVRPEDYRACGATCLYAASSVLKLDVDFEQLTADIGPDESGFSSFQDLSRVAEKHGLFPCGISLPIANFELLPTPSILHLKTQATDPAGNHFALFLGLTAAGDPVLLEPPQLPMEVPRSRLAAHWTGKALALCQSHEERTQLARRIQQAAGDDFSRYAAWSLALLSAVTFVYWSAATPGKRGKTP